MKVPVICYSILWDNCLVDSCSFLLEKVANYLSIFFRFSSICSKIGSSLLFANSLQFVQNQVFIVADTSHRLVREKLCPSTKVWIDYEFEKPYAPARPRAC